MPLIYYSLNQIFQVCMTFLYTEELESRITKDMFRSLSKHLMVLLIEKNTRYH